MEKLLKALDLLKGWYGSGFHPTRDEIQEAMTVLEQGIEEARLCLEDMEEQEVIRHINSIPKPLKTRYDQRHVQRNNEDMLALPHDILKNMKDSNREFRSTPTGDSPFFADALRHAGMMDKVVSMKPDSSIHTSEDANSEAEKHVQEEHHE